MTLRHLVVVLGDQLDGASAAFDGFDPARDAVLQMEVREEATYVPQHRLRLAYFFASMRQFRDEQRGAGRRVIYRALDDPDNRGSFAAELRHALATLAPERLILVEPGDRRVRDAITGLGLPLELRPDRHFLCTRAEFDALVPPGKPLLLERFYRGMRRRLGVLIEPDGSPTGGAWNFDAENRAGFGRAGPPMVPPRPRFTPDAVTRDALAMVAREFPDAPGRCEGFDLPVTRADAEAALTDFVQHRLPLFGRFQDAMWSGQPFLFHSHLSGPLNLHRLHPRTVLDAVLANPARAPLAAVEGFVRQLIGWREYVRGIYDRLMPAYADENALGAELPMPRFYWTGETDMRCLAEAIGHTIDHAYAHHIERLMVLGLFAQLLGVRPHDVNRWHLSMFWDAIDWVSLPNVIGMSQHADGGRMATKPYVASGRYIDRMSDHCRHCRYDPTKAVGDDACPFTTLYWDFLDRHRGRFARNPRMVHAYANLARRDSGEVGLIRHRADALKATLTAETFLPPAA